MLYFIILFYIIIYYLLLFIMSLGSVVGIVAGYGIHDRRVGVRAPVGSRVLLLLVVQTGSGFHQTSYRLGTGRVFPGGKAAGT
jgi:hypothetical protein